MNYKKEEKKYFYGKVLSPISNDVEKKLLREMSDHCFTGSVAWGHELHHTYVDYKYSIENYGLFGLLTREVKEKVIKDEFFPIIVEKKENCYIDIISGEVYKLPASPGHISLGTYRDVDLVWLANYLKNMTKEKIDIYTSLMIKLKMAVADEYNRQLSEKNKMRNRYNEADNYINEFKKKYRR